MNKLLRIVIYALLGITTLGIIVLCYYNAKNNAKFWEISIFNGITMLWTVGLSFIVTQSFSRYQRKADVVIKMLQELLESISEHKTCQFGTSIKQEDILMQNRQIRQRISLVGKYAKKFGIEPEITFIDERFKEYEETISEHISDSSYLSQSYTVLARPIKLMQERIYQAILKI